MQCPKQALLQCQLQSQLLGVKNFISKGYYVKTKQAGSNAG